MRPRPLLALVAAASAVLAMPGTTPSAAATISMSGSSTALPVVADLAYFYQHAERGAPRFSLVAGGSAAGISDAARGVVSAGLVSRAKASSDPRGLVFTPFALSGVCVVTNRSNRLPGLSRALIQDLVAGRVTRWAQVPGSPRTDAIAAAGLVAGTGARSVFMSTFVEPGTTVAYRPRAFTSAAQQRDFVLATPAAWSYVDLHYTTGLHPVPVDGIPCTRATVLSGAYPATRPLSIVTRGAPRRAVARFVRWIRTSDVARRVIATRYIPVH